MSENISKRHRSSVALILVDVINHFEFPSDCSAARTRREHEQAIEHIKEMTSASVVASPFFRVSELRGESRRKRSKA